MEIYSNAFAHEETGDVLGYDLALKRRDDSAVEAFFYVYEGAPNNDAIPLTGRISGKNLRIQGDWEEHLIEFPSRKKIVQTHLVKIDGVLDSSSFKGEVTIEGRSGRESVRLKHVEGIWLCKGRTGSVVSPPNRK
jgi:hypothetical protein